MRAVATDVSAYQIDLRQGPVRDGDDLVFGAMVFRRDDNENGLEPEIFDPRDGDGPALRLAVKPGFFAAPNANEDPRHNERCELRDRAKLMLGTVVWYGFSMRVPAGFTAAPVRLVCAQFKAPYDPSGDVSPLFAVRIFNGRFLATTEHLFEPGDEPTLRELPAGEQCSAGSARVLDGHNFTASDRRPNLEYQVRMILGTDRDGLPTPLDASYRSCADGIAVETAAALPILDDRWHDFMVGIEASRTKDELGTVRLYVDGALSATARGEYGRAEMKAHGQYFKLGIYRDKSALWGPGTMCLEYRNIRRGATLESVELPASSAVA